MQIKIIIFYCICEELLKAMEHREDIQVKMTDAEVMTVVLTAARFFKGNIRIAMISTWPKVFQDFLYICKYLKIYGQVLIPQRARVYSGNAQRKQALPQNTRH